VFDPLRTPAKDTMTVTDFLGLPRGATKGEILTAVKKLFVKLHPDRLEEGVNAITAQKNLTYNAQVKEFC
jgi:curved DNA-binding protein CbpA